jgi:hypothetical protein
VYGGARHGKRSKARNVIVVIAEIIAEYLWTLHKFPQSSDYRLIVFTDYAIILEIDGILEGLAYDDTWWRFV